MEDGYLDWREERVDRSEWRDILSGLRILGARKGSRIYEVGAGRGHLMEYLLRRGYRVAGCDLRGDGIVVGKCDLTREYPPPATEGVDYYVFQHLLEHLPGEAQRRLLAYMLGESRGVVGVLPGHYTVDPTHIVNHYSYRDVVGLLEDVQDMIGSIHYVVVPDTRSFLAPRWRDWVLIASKKPFRFSYRRFYGLGFTITRKLLKAFVELRWRL